MNEFSHSSLRWNMPIFQYMHGNAQAGYAQLSMHSFVTTSIYKDILSQIVRFFIRLKSI